MISALLMVEEFTVLRLRVLRRWWAGADYIALV